MVTFILVCPTIITFTLVCILLLLTVEAVDNTRVSRIKPNFARRQTEGRARMISTVSPLSTTGIFNKPEFLTPDVDKRLNHQVGKDMPSTVSTVTRKCNKPYSCLNCTTYRLCAPSAHGFVELFSGSCPVDRPYCDNYSGTCVNSVAAAVKCASPDNSFRCMTDGHFPHPSDPARYFICSQLKAYGYSCKDGYKYYAPSQGCSKFTWIANPFDCSDLNATKVLYSNGGSFFAYCVNGSPYLINRCGENEFFNTTSQVCEPQCTKEFLAPDNNNCKNYFSCFRNTKTMLFEKVLLECPHGEGFDSKMKKCVPSSQLPNCLIK